jgi:tRNA A37 threonylcarbamoyladenosine dehydratase
MNGPIGLPAVDAPDLERRFGSLRRLWGDRAYEAVRASRIAVVGVGGVGSWCAEALGRCGVAGLALIDLDQVAESNINRQVQALGHTVGAAKVVALAERLADIHPGCRIDAVEAFVEADNWPSVLPGPVDVVVDACDNSATKLLLARWALATGFTLVTVGAAGGKSQPHAVHVEDLAQVTHDPLLARLRQQLRRDGHGATQPFGLRCVYSRERVVRPAQADSDLGGGLNCHGYGSSVMVTATFGMTAAEAAVYAVRSAVAEGA